MEKRPPAIRIGITGAAGHIGTTLRRELPPSFILSLFDRTAIGDPRAAVVDFSRAEEAAGIFAGLHAVIHLAADARHSAPWESVLPNNIVATHNVLEEARRAGVRRLVFASTNHVQHGYSMGDSPVTLGEGYRGEGRRLIRLSDPPAPDSLYAVSKLWGEELGRYYARRFRMEVVALRIGWTVREDTPLIKRGTPSEGYMRAMFLSARDCAAAFARALEAPTEPGEFLLAYAISMNDRRVFDMTETGERLGFIPRDNAESYFREPGAKLQP